MSETVRLFSFADHDRSGKVRWVAAELGLTVVEERVGFGAHVKPPYAELNPLRQIPTVVFRGETLRESTAICHHLAEAVEAPKLTIDRGEPGRDAYLYALAVFGETLEARLVECAVSRAGILGPEYFTLHEKFLRRKLAVVAAELPDQGFLAGDRFTLADVLAGYALRLALATGLLERPAVEPYFGRLVERPGAQASRIFSSLV